MNPPIARRGIPRDLSPQLRVDILRGEYEMSADLTGGEDYAGTDHTWLYWDDVEPVIEQVRGRGWRSVFEVMRTLVKCHGEANVRLLFSMQK